MTKMADTGRPISGLVRMQYLSSIWTQNDTRKTNQKTHFSFGKKFHSMTKWQTEISVFQVRRACNDEAVCSILFLIGVALKK